MLAISKRFPIEINSGQPCRLNSDWRWTAGGVNAEPGRCWFPRGNVNPHSAHTYGLRGDGIRYDSPSFLAAANSASCAKHYANLVHFEFRSPDIPHHGLGILFLSLCMAFWVIKVVDAGSYAGPYCQHAVPSAPMTSVPMFSARIWSIRSSKSESVCINAPDQPGISPLNSTSRSRPPVSNLTGNELRKSQHPSAGRSTVSNPAAVLRWIRMAL